MKGDRNPLRCEGSEEARKNLSKSMMGNKNSKGHVWITNGIENQRIHINQDVPDGWWRGQSSPGYLRYKYRWVTKDCENLKVREDLVEKYLSEGWKVGRYVPPRRATTIESITQEKDLSE